MHGERGCTAREVHGERGCTAREGARREGGGGRGRGFMPSQVVSQYRIIIKAASPVRRDGYGPVFGRGPGEPPVGGVDGHRLQKDSKLDVVRESACLVTPASLFLSCEGDRRARE